MRVFYCLLLFFCISCSQSDSHSPTDCTAIIADQAKFDSTVNFGPNLLEYTLDEFCLKVKLGVSGCDDNHLIEMVYNGTILKSLPPQVIVDFYDNDPQACEAYFELERQYDLSTLLTSSTDEIVIRFRNNETSFTLSI